MINFKLSKIFLFLLLTIFALKGQPPRGGGKIFPSEDDPLPSENEPLPSENEPLPLGAGRPNPSDNKRVQRPSKRIQPPGKRRLQQPSSVRGRFPPSRPKAKSAPKRDYRSPKPIKKPSSSATTTKKKGKPITRFKTRIKNKKEMVHIDFPEPTELKEVIKAVAQWTGKNIVLGRNVNGKVQIISPTEVTKKEAYEVFLSALNVGGFTTIEEGKVLKIVHNRAAMKENIRTFKGKSFPKTAQIITRVIPLKYVNATQIKKTLDPFVQRSELVVYEPTNTIILSTTGHKVDRVLQIINLLDVKTQQPVVKIIAIQYADAKDIASKLKQIFVAGTAKKGKRGGPSGNFYISKILTDERTNSIIFLGNTRAFTEVLKLINKLDQPLDELANQARIHIHALQFSDAMELAKTLSSLASGRRPSSRSSRFKGSKKSKTTTPAVADFGDLKITAEPTTNSLIVTGSKTAYHALVPIINKIDVRRAQVFVEADILDIHLSDGINLGTSIIAGEKSALGIKDAKGIYGFNAKDSFGLSALGAAQQTTGSTTAGGGIASAASAASLLSHTVLGVLGGTDVEIFPNVKISTPTALITALKMSSNTTVLSTPSIMTSDNEEASMSVGHKVSFLKFHSTTTDGIPVNSTDFEEVSLSLNLKPKVSASDAITMLINLKDQELGTKDVNGQPPINKRETKTIVTVDNHQTIVISGLVRHLETEGKSKIPIIGDIPIIGWLFSKSSIDKQQNYLLVFLTPHVVRNKKDISKIYHKKMKEQEEFLATAFGKNYRKSHVFKHMDQMNKSVDKNNKEPAPEKKPTSIKEKKKEEKYKEEDEIIVPMQSFDTPSSSPSPSNSPNNSSSEPSGNPDSTNNDEMENKE